MSSRTYVVGLPVLITVHDDGTVEWDIDRSEAGSGINENYPSTYDKPPLAQEVVDDDVERIEADVEERRAAS